LKLLSFETIAFIDATLSDINVVLCYVLSQYLFGTLKIRSEFSVCALHGFYEYLLAPMSLPAPEANSLKVLSKRGGGE
jgi:hypothetical protein